jgi:zinc/manganese transport system ATP-binding protein
LSPVLSFRDLTLGYDRHPAVHHLDGEVHQGELLAICGPNGAGKSTLLKGITGALTPLHGTILRHAKRRDIGYLPQAAEIDRTFPINVFDMVAMGLCNRQGLFRSIGRSARDEIFRAIATVGLTGFEERGIGTLSGGQMQRMLFARLLLQNTSIILLDEPFTAIDAKTADDLLQLMKDWHGEGRTILAVLHDMDLVRRHFPQTLLIAREEIAWGETCEALHPENLLRARRMIEAFDRSAETCDRSAETHSRSA